CDKSELACSTLERRASVSAALAQPAATRAAMTENESCLAIPAIDEHLHEHARDRETKQNLKQLRVAHRLGGLLRVGRGGLHEPLVDGVHLDIARPHVQENAAGCRLRHFL